MSIPDENNVIYEYDAALETYFKLKSRYEENKISMQRLKMNQDRIKNDKNDGKVRKIKDFKDVCIICKRSGGSIFKKVGDTYFGKCGNKNMCFEIELHNNIFFNGNANDEYYSNKNNLEKLKDNIVKQKMKTFFNYISKEDSVLIFENQINEYVKEEESFNGNEFYHNLFLNKSDELEKIKKQEQGIKDYKIIINESMNDRDETNLLEFTRSKVEMQQKLHEMYKELRNFKYQSNEVETDMNISTLIQKPIKFNVLYEEASEKKVVKMNFV
jgi:hypothetical protein